MQRKNRVRFAGLDAHVRKHIYHKLLEVGIFDLSIVRLTIMRVAQRPSKKHRAGTKDQCTAVIAVEGQVVRGNARLDRVALIHKDRAPRNGRFRQVDQPGGAIFILWRGIPLVPQYARCDVQSAGCSQARVAPETQTGIFDRYIQCAAKFAGAIGPENRAYQ